MENLQVVREKFKLGMKLRLFSQKETEDTYWDLEVVGVNYHTDGESWVQFRSRKKGLDYWMEDDGEFYDLLLNYLQSGALIVVKDFVEAPTKIDRSIKIICGCEKEIRIELGEEFNHKDVAHCECGRKFLVVELV